MILLFILSVYLPADKNRAQKVKNAFREAWLGYKKCSYGRDFLRPISCKGSDWLNASLTLIDSLDTLWILGYTHDFDDAVNWLENNFEYSAKGPVFELVIRVIGGLMSAYQLSGRESLLNIASNFASQLLVAFDTPTHLPMPNIDMVSGRPSTWGWAPRSTFLAHVGSLSPELMTLAQHSKSFQFRNTSDRILNFFFTHNSFNGLWPTRIDFSTGLFADLDLSFDAYCDSFYEYLLKLYILTDGQCTKCGQLYNQSIEGMRRFLLRNTTQGTYVGKIKSSSPDDSLTYLSFFLPGMISLGAQYLNKDDMDLAISLANTFAKWHNNTVSGLMGDAYHLTSKNLTLTDTKYKLRPEFIESCFYLFRFTGDSKWREIGWKIFESLSINCRATHGFGELKDVNHPELGIEDIQDSYLLAETFKYSYLLFSNSSVIPLDQYVFTTEAHPLRHFDQKWMKEHYKGFDGFTIKSKKKDNKKKY